MKNETGLTALHFAAQNNNVAMITYLIDVIGLDLNELDAKESTAVHWAVWNGHDLALNYLLARKTKINQQDKKGMTPLHLAVLYSEQIRTTMLIRMLLQRGADPFIHDNKKRTALEYGREKF